MTSEDLYKLIDPPVMLRTSDKLVAVRSDVDEMVITLSGIQPKLLKRRTKKAVKQQIDDCLKFTIDLGFKPL